MCEDVLAGAGAVLVDRGLLNLVEQLLRRRLLDRVGCLEVRANVSDVQGVVPLLSVLALLQVLRGVWMLSMIEGINQTVFSIFTDYPLDLIY